MLKMAKISAVALFATALLGCGQGKTGAATATAIAAPNSAEVVAVLNGADITNADLMKKLEPQLKRFESEIYKMKEMALGELIDDRLLEQAAKADGKSADAYMEDYLKKNATEPSEEEVKKFYDYRKEQMGGKSFEDAKAQITEFLKSNQKAALRNKLLDGLRASAKVEIKMEPPRVDVKVGNSPTKGPEGAPVTVIEYSDYQCPYCSRARPTVNQIIEAYPDDVLYVFKDFPLSFHKDSQKAHEAAHCAGDQGKYWEMNKILFENQGALGVSDLKGYAQKVGLNMSKFNKCLDNGTHAKKVSESLNEGQTVGVSGTPAFFINGVMLSGARPIASFKEQIDAELKRKK
jgi:protein-disulfide isomerase